MVLATTDRQSAYFGGWPCKLRTSGLQGRHLIASRAIAEGEVVLLSEYYLRSISPAFKKRVCACCLRDGGRRLETCCRACSQVWYCSDSCLQAHARGARVSPAPQVAVNTPQLEATLQSVPHSLVCPVLKLFSGTKCGADLESVLYMLLELLAQQHLQQSACGEHGNAGRRPGGVPQPQLSHADFLGLTSHDHEMCAKDRRDWLKGINFLVTSLHRAQWPGRIPTAAEMLQAVGKICANNFGIYLHDLHREPTLPAQQPVEAPEPAPSTTNAAAVSEVEQLLFDCHFSMAGAKPVLAWPLVEDVAQSLADASAAASADADSTATDSAFSLPESASSSSVSDLTSVQHASRPSSSPSLASLEEEPLHSASGSNPAVDLPTGHSRSAVAENGGHGCVSAAGDGPGCSDASVSVLDDEPGSAAGDRPAAVGPNGRPLFEEAVGRELYITASYFNHSCDPNCLMDRGVGAVVAQEDIEAGQELTISYIDLQLPRSTRRDALLEDFFFHCACTRCEAELRGGSIKCSYARSTRSMRKSFAPKKRGRKARISR